ncbi:MAG: hypothetical protein B1H06_05425 [Candidatus Cloacimonas sp. 4484_143]|nr:MAG: hypothetical protein B1H06_05425 [Candidatus Cloacimonas sp. 4484_143]
MLKDQILRKGLISAPEKLEIDVILYAVQELNKEEETDILENLSWLPFAGSLLIIRDLLTGQKFRIVPEIKI